MTNTLADRYAILKQEMERVKAELENTRDAILATGQEVLVGEKCIIQVKLQDRNTVDWKSAVTDKLDPETVTAWAAEYNRTTKNIATLSIKPKL